MAVGDRLYTGRDTGVTIQPLDRLSRSQERMDDLLIQADELRLKSFKEGQSRFLEMGKVPLETYISSNNAKVQGELVDKYNEKATNILKQRGGSFENFTTQDWVDLQTGRQMIESAQAKMNTDLERFKIDEEQIKRDGGRTYDLNKWAEIKRKYIEDGVYSEDPLPIRTKSITEKLSERAKDYAGQKVNTTLDIIDAAGTKLKREAWANMTLEQAQSEIKDTILRYDAERQDVMEQFAALPETERAKWLGDRDGVLEEGEATDENGVIAWAQQHKPFIDAIMRVDSSTPTGIGGTSEKSGIPIKLAGVDVRVPVGEKQSNGMYSLGGKTSVNYIKTDGAFAVNYGREYPLKEGKNMIGQLVDYDPKEDFVYVRSSTGVSELNIEPKQIIKVPAANIPGIENHPIMGDDGKITTIGAIRGGGQVGGQATTETPAQKAMREAKERAKQGK